MAYRKGNLSGVPYPSHAGEVVAIRGTVTIPLATANGDIFEVSAIPSGCRVVDVIIEADKLDSHATAAVEFDVGLMSGEVGDNDSARTVGAEFLSGSVAAQAGGVARTDLASAFRVTPAGNDRGVGIKVTTKAATAVVGSIGVTVLVTAS